MWTWRMFHTKFWYQNLQNRPSHFLRTLFIVHWFRKYMPFKKAFQLVSSRRRLWGLMRKAVDRPRTSIASGQRFEYPLSFPMLGRWYLLLLTWQLPWWHLPFDQKPEMVEFPRNSAKNGVCYKRVEGTTCEPLYKVIAQKYPNDNIQKSPKGPKLWFMN